MANAIPFSPSDIKELGEIFSLSPEGELLKDGKRLVLVQPSHTYFQIRVKLSSRPRRLLIHRIVFVLANGYDPAPLEVDHVDRDRSNNHPSNLRAVTKSTNLKNRRSCKKHRSLSNFLASELR